MAKITLVSVDELKTYIDIQAGNTTFDEKLLSLAAASTTLLGNFCRKQFDAKAYAEYFNTRDGSKAVYDLSSTQNVNGYTVQKEAQRFTLKGFPIDTAEAFTVHYDPTWVFGADTLVDAANYYLDENLGALYLYLNTGANIRALKVAYTAGYTSTQETFGVGEAAYTYTLVSGAPEDLKMACTLQTIFLFNKVQESNIGVVGRDKHSPEYVSNEMLLCPEAQAMAMPYRRLLTGRR